MKIALRLRRAARKLPIVVLFFVALFGTTAATFKPALALNNKYDSQFYSGQKARFYDPRVLGCGVTGATVTSLSGADNREKIWNFLLAVGLSSVQAAGVLGNIEVESGGTFSPTIQQFDKAFGTGAYGIAQWDSRRDALINYMREYFLEPVAESDEEEADTEEKLTPRGKLLETYYTPAYSTKGKSYTGEADGFIAKNADTGEKMSETDNDALLLAQLSFLIEESSERVVRAATAEVVEGVSVGDSELGSLKKLDTVADASNFWVYNFEIPARIAETAKDRVVRAQLMYDKYANSVERPVCSKMFSGTLREQIVQLAEYELSLWEAGKVKQVAPAALSGTEDYTKYTYGQTGDWCAWFTSWILAQAGHPVDSTDTPDWPGVAQFYFRSESIGFKTYDAGSGYQPQPGDFAIYNGTEHINVVVGYEGSKMITIGGNQGASGNGSFNISKVTRNVGYGNGATSYISVGN